jgi:CheY-like chemotaxis protein
MLQSITKLLTSRFGSVIFTKVEMQIPSASECPAVARILMVDDNRSGLAARKTVLEELGHRVTTATRADDAFELLSKTPFNLVITDHRLAKINGVELIRKIHEAEFQVPVILLSSLVEALGLTESSTGADVVLPKSANELTHLTRAVARLLRKPAGRKPPHRQAAPTKTKRQRA